MAVELARGLLTDLLVFDCVSACRGTQPWRLLTGGMIGSGRAESSRKTKRRVWGFCLQQIKADGRSRAGKGWAGKRRQLGMLPILRNVLQSAPAPSPAVVGLLLAGPTPTRRYSCGTEGRYSKPG